MCFDYPSAVFVYGTLMRGGVRAGRWPREPLSVERAVARGRLYDLGPYPAMTAGDDVVAGELWRFEQADMEETLRVLDEIECFGQQGVDLYVRCVIDCETEHGAARRAHVYFIADPDLPRPDQRILPDASGHCRWPAGPVTIDTP